MKNEITNINPLCDFGFKRIFGTEENKPLLMAFLNTIVSSDTGVITDLQYLPQEQIGNHEFEKDVIFDIYCTNSQGDHFIIEMQRSKQHFFANRVITYMSRVISKMLPQGDRRYGIPKVYSINILDFQPDMFPEKEKYVWKVMLKDDSNRIFSDRMLLYFFKLSNFAAQTTEKRQCFENELEKWLYYLKNIQNMDEQDYQNEHDPVFRQLLKQCSYSNLNDMEQEEYKKSLLDYEGIRDAVACAREDGIAEGIEKGMEKGVEKGIQQVALQMLSIGLDISTVAKATGLPESEIKELEVRN